MFRPKYPPQDTHTTTTAPLPTPSADPGPVPVQPYVAGHAPAARPAVQITPAALATGTAAVLVVGTVLVSMLLAVAITAASVAICALVLRSMHQHTRR
ncbi:SpdD protein [Streptomyces sp. NPDC048639]|uniref:SpdD protein n=1 Tax=Streptomyces sp. NPDC048639 TaxID=3365581 RepID=UPI003721CAF0